MNAASVPYVLVVEDDRDLGDVLRENLLAEGCGVDVARTGEDALELARRHSYDLLLLDVMLPGVDGFSICETLRREGQLVPILFLTARGDTRDRIRGLEAGGDDYLAKPFELRELLLRVHGLLRRGMPSQQAPTIHFGENRFDLQTGRAVAWDGVEHQIEGKEAAVLALLSARESEVLSRDTILDEVWRHEVFPSTRVVEDLIVKLRRRFEPDPERPCHFHQVSGRGVRFTREPRED